MGQTKRWLWWLLDLFMVGVSIYCASFSHELEPRFGFWVAAGYFAAMIWWAWDKSMMAWKHRPWLESAE